MQDDYGNALIAKTLYERLESLTQGMQAVNDRLQQGDERMSRIEGNNERLRVSWRATPKPRKRWLRTPRTLCGWPRPSKGCSNSSSASPVGRAP